MTWNHVDIGTRFVGPNAMIANLEHFDLKVHRATNYFLTDTF